MNISSSTREAAVPDAENTDFLFRLTAIYNQKVFLRQQSNKGNFRQNIRKNVLMVQSISPWRTHPKETLEVSLLLESFKTGLENTL